MKVLVVDNYDSFTYNLVDSLRSLQVEFKVVFNDQIEEASVEKCQKILISPGPGTPEEAGGILELIARFKNSKSFLGVCLGHQAIAQIFGAHLINIPTPRHGQTASINLSADDLLFSGLPKRISGGLYYSWTVDKTSLPQELEVIATNGGQIMGLRHQHFDIAGIQFHPESYATPFGIDILRNWLNE